MSDLTDAIDRWDEWELGGTFSIDTFANTLVPIINAARQVANPDLDLAHRFDVMRIGGPTADGRVHLNGSLSSDEWGRLQAALSITESAR